MHGYYLRQGDRDPAVLVLKACLVHLLGHGAVPRPGDPGFDAAMRTAVIRFQHASGLAADGVVGPASWAAIGKKLGYSALLLPNTDHCPEWIKNLLLNAPRTTAPRHITDLAFVGLYQTTYGKLSASQHDGLTALVDAISADGAVTDVRWAAYMLATVKHECANTWRPIEEYGKGAGRPYGVPVSVKDAAGKVHVNTYYGRGYVQLTWEANYRKLGHEIGLGNQLVIRPELALDRTVAYKILSYGMRNGSFTGVGLSDFITGDVCDFRNARKIINGLDQADLIAGYAENLLIMLLASIPARAKRPSGVVPMPVAPPHG